LVGLGVSVVYRGCALPVAWTVVPAPEKQAWRGEWLRRLGQVRAGVPRRFLVMVLAARGVSARRLLQRRGRLGWHPLLRSTTGGPFRPAASVHSQPLRAWVPEPGTPWVGTGTAFQGPRRRLPGPLRARGDEGYRAPWWLRTALAPSAGAACW
jgi:hypothetical protein